MSSVLNVSAMPVEEVNAEVITPDSEYYLTAEEIINGQHFSREKIETATANGAVILGGIDAPLSEISMTRAQVITGQVWCRSYATYDQEEGISVNVELYVPWYYLANPKFTFMSGPVEVDIVGQTTTHICIGLADEEKTISADVDTGRKAPSGSKGEIDIFGVAKGTNILSGAGEYQLVYEIQIP